MLRLITRDDPPSPPQDRGAREGGRSRARPHAPAACSRRNYEVQANPRQHARAPRGPRPGTASEHETERYGGPPFMARATPRTPALLPAQERQRDGPRQGDPPPHWPPRPHSRGGTAYSPPPPPTPPPGAETPQTRRPTPGGAHSPKPGRGEAGPGRPPPPQKTKQTTRGTGPGQDTRRGTDRVERPYQRPAPGPREVRAPHRPGEGGGGGRRGSASAHTHKGHAGNTRRATGPSPRNAQTAWNGVPASEGKGHPDRTARHTQRRTRGAGRGKRGRHDTRYRPEPPELAASAAHTRPGHCTRPGSSGATPHAPAPRLGSLGASPRGSHWPQASSTGPAAPAARATTHQGGDAVAAK